RILKENMRAIDIAARYGGEEFVAILPETNKKGALTLAERIRKRVEKESFEGNKQQPTVNKTVSLGVATYPIDATTQPKLIEKADQALYRAKRGEGIG
ncbi:MAG: GGDEF domain-containing protein, partial [Actinomycetota bacterium]